MISHIIGIKYSWHKSIYCALTIITAINTICGVIGFSVRDIHERLSWWACLLILLAFYVALTIIIHRIIRHIDRQPVHLDVNGNQVEIKTGDLFLESGLKLIPFNEYFDTVVDDIIISKNTLNGLFLTRYVENQDDLMQCLNNAPREKCILKPVNDGDRIKYPLGRIVPYNDYLLLAFSRFNDQNEAHIDIIEYEQCLFRMWNEIRRTYSGRDVIIPLIGSGITTFDGINKKDNTSLLKCIICTLKASGVQLNSTIRIILMESTRDTIDMDIIRKEFD